MKKITLLFFVLLGAIKKGSTIAYFDTQTLYAGMYFVKITNHDFVYSKSILVTK